MKKVALIIPIYPPHYNYAKRFIQSFNQFNFEEQADLWFCFSNTNEAEQFGFWPNKIILPSELSQVALCNKGIINVKKIYSLEKLKEKYEFLWVLDSESVIIKGMDLYAMCQNYYADKLLYCNITENDLLPVISSCKKYFSQTDQEILNQYDDYYFWFNQLCIYKTSYLDDFLAKTDLISALPSLGPLDFDYIIYMNYLILYRNWKVERLPCIAPYGLLEGYKYLPSYFFLRHSNFRPYHCHKDLFPELVNSENVFVFIQLDINKSLPSHKKKAKAFLKSFLFKSRMG